MGLTDNKLVTLALQGYNPFQPDVGIFCGGYQGPLYPNPTTLVYPGFNPYNYTNPTMSTYTMSNEYSGLGVGNPGIDYKNAGHILGLLDTFSRMSYGISMWQSIHAGTDASSFAPAVSVSIPIISYSEGGATSFGPDDIYPAYSEYPYQWIDGFDVDENGSIDPDPRTFAAFAGGGHTPATEAIDEEALNSLFADKTVLSYIGMPQYFRSVTSSLVAAAESLESQSSTGFTMDNPADFNNYCHYTNYFNNQSDENETWTQGGNFYVQCFTVSPSEALEILTGETDYHDGTNGQNEYRSLTELNSVVNIMPLQVVGATFWTMARGYTFVFPPGEYITYESSSRTLKTSAYMIADFVMNISDIPPDPDNPEPGTVTITGTASVDSLVSDVTQFYFQEAGRINDVGEDTEEGTLYDAVYGHAEVLRKNINIEMSMTNEFAWDAVWLGGGGAADSYNDSDVFADDNGEEGGSTGLPDSVGISTVDQSPLELSFSKTFTMGAGCTSVRMRAILRNRQTLSQPGYTNEDNWVPVQFCHEHGFIIFNPGFHCHYPAGVHSNGYAGSPDSIPDNFNTSLHLSFTVTGSYFSAKSFSVDM